MYGECGRSRGSRLPEREDEWHVHRELRHLRQERTALCNRICSLLVLHNLRVERIGGRAWGAGGLSRQGNCRRVCALRLNASSSGGRLSPDRSGRLKRYRPVRSAAAHNPRSRCWRGSRVLELTAHGPRGKELFGWWQFHKSREVVGCLCVVPTPYASSTSEVEQGISNTGNKRTRWIMVDSLVAGRAFSRPASLANGLLRAMQAPASAGIVALVLWRYLVVQMVAIWEFASGVPVRACRWTGASAR
jgi:transposase